MQAARPRLLGRRTRNIRKGGKGPAGEPQDGHRSTGGATPATVARPPSQSGEHHSKEDERGLAEAARGVRDGSKLKLEQFLSEDAFNTLRNFNTMLTAFIIEVVELNIDEVEVLGGNPERIHEARSRVTKAGAGAPQR